MTAQFNESKFQPKSFQRPAAPVGGGPPRLSMSEHFWGYEVRSHDEVFGIALLARATAGFVALAMAAAAAGVWLLPAMTFSQQALAMKVMISVMLVCGAIFLACVAARGTRVHVQIDTASGDVREVVRGIFGGDVVMARYGFDTVRAVDVVPSRAMPAVGQIRITIAGGVVLPAGDGALTALAPLRDRLASDFGLRSGNTPHVAEWNEAKGTARPRAAL